MAVSALNGQNKGTTNLCLKLHFNDFKSGTTITRGTAGLYCWKNRTARFDNIHVYAGGNASKPAPGRAATPREAFEYRPGPPDLKKPLYDPAAPENNLFAGEAFAGFDARAPDSIRSPSSGTPGVVAAARVKVFDAQVYRFFGLIFNDGSFHLASRIGIAPLTLRVAGVAVPLPLALQGRLVLSGRSRGAATQAFVNARGWAAWKG